MNDSLETIAEKLKEADSVYLFPHENPDGDAIGSTAAICSLMRGMGKECIVLIDEELPDNLKFMDDNGMFVIPEGSMKAPDISMCVDCSQITRFPKLMDIFRSGAFSITLDHHLNDSPFCDLNYIDPKASACGELVFKLMKVMGHKPTKREAEDLFGAIATDNGNFLYANTTKQSHEIVSELYDSGMDVSYVGTEIYENVAPRKMMLESLAVDRMEFYDEGRIVFTVITQEMLKKTGAMMSDSDPVVAKLRTLEGVEMAIVLKERGEDLIFASMRSKSYSNVRKIAVEFGGGGHRKAAGCTIRMTLEEASKAIIECAVRTLEEEREAQSREQKN